MTQRDTLDDLRSTVAGLDQKLMLVTSQNRNLEDEIANYNKRFEQLQAEKEEAEGRCMDQ